MNVYRIENAATGIVLGEYEALDEIEALDVMAIDAGYSSYIEAQSVAPCDDIVVTLIRKVPS